MLVRVENVTMDCHAERRLAPFWRDALAFQVMTYVPVDWMAFRTDEPLFPRLSLDVEPKQKLVNNRVYLDMVPTAGLQRDEIQRLERPGAQHFRDFESDPDEWHGIRADPERYEFCCSRSPWDLWTDCLP